MSNFVLKTCPVFVCSLAIFSLSLIYLTTIQLSNHTFVAPGLLRRPTTRRGGSFESAIWSRKNTDNNIIILALVDDGYVELARNVFETSFRRHSIDNYVFVGFGARTCPPLTSNGIVCVARYADVGSSRASRFGTTSFNRKSRLKLLMVIIV